MKCAVTGMLLLAACPLTGATKWIRVTTPHFELYTDTSEASARKTIQYFEQLRSFFSQLSEYSQPQILPVRIVQFSSNELLKPYKLVEWEAGHYEGNGSRDWIAIAQQSEAAINTQLIAHEYNHLMASRAGLYLPHWMAEGIADFFSTLRSSGEGTAVGDLISERVRTLTPVNLLHLNLDVLTSTDDKTYKSMKDIDAVQFYAASWGLIHMLYLAPEYSINYRKFVSSQVRGGNAAESFQQAYGRTSAAVYADLKAYWAQPHKSIGLLTAKMDFTEVPASLGLATEFEMSLVLADLFAVMKNEKEARAAFDKLNQAFNPSEQIRESGPDRATPLTAMYFNVARSGWHENEAHEDLLGRLENILQLPQLQNAPASRAVETAELYYEFAMIERHAKVSNTKVISALVQALQLRPGYLAAMATLGLTYLDANDYSSAASTFTRIPVNSPEANVAASGLNGVATAYANSGRFDEARKTAESGRKWDRTAAQSSERDLLLVYIAERTANLHLQSGNLKEARAYIDVARKLAVSPGDLKEIERLQGLVDARSKGRLAARPDEKLLRAQGTTKALDCPVAGPLLRVMVEDKEMMFDLPDPSGVEISSAGDASVELNCGALKPIHVVIDYAPPGISNRASAGVVRKMAF